MIWAVWLSMLMMYPPSTSVPAPTRSQRITTSNMAARAIWDLDPQSDPDANEAEEPEEEPNRLQQEVTEW